MERRPYFVIGDFVANVTVGVASALVVRVVVGASWNPLIGMLAGMALGMLVAAPIGVAFTPFFGALEIMLPTTLTGMLTGMLVGMLETMRPADTVRSAWIGALIGVGVVTWSYWVTARDSRVGSRNTT